MQIKKVYSNIYTASNKYKSSVQNNKGLYTDSITNNKNLLSSQLSFMGIINTAEISPIQDIGDSVLETCFKKLKKFPIDSELDNFRDINNKVSWFLFKHVTNLDKALDTFGKMDENVLSSTYDLYYIQQAVKNSELPNFRIKGCIGKGLYSSAFLTNDNKVIKLACMPNFASKKYFLNTTEVPNYKTNITKNHIYGTLGPLTEVGDLYFLNKDGTYNIEGFHKTRTELVNKIFEAGYTPAKDFQDDIAFAKQIGFIQDKAFIIDAGCMDNRPLATSLD